MRPHLDLMSGIGGFALAARWAGYDTIGFCEIDPFCRRVLGKHWPNRPIHDDIRTLTGDAIRGWIGEAVGVGHKTDSDSLGQRHVPNGPSEACVSHVISQPGRLDILTAGYPCQPFSHAGKRLGATDDRHLWPEVARLVADLRPRWCLFENVAGHISLGLDDVLSDLEDLGYTWGAAVIPACAVNAPHRRDRIWIVAHVAHADGSVSIPSGPGQDQGRPADATIGGGAVVAHAGRGDGDGRAAQPGRHQRDGSDAGRAEGPGGADERGGGQALSGLGSETYGLSSGLVGHMSAWDGDWEAGTPRTTDKEDNRVNKLKALGNSIVPQVCYVIMQAIMEASNE